MITKVTALKLLKRKAQRRLRTKKGTFGNNCGSKLRMKRRSKAAPSLMNRKKQKLHWPMKGIFGSNCGYKLWAKKQARAAVKRSVRINDIAIAKKHSKSAEITKKVRKLAEKNEKISRNLTSLTEANKKAREVLRKLDNLKPRVSSMYEKRNRLNTQFGTFPPTVPPTIVADPIPVPVLLHDGANNADGQEDVVAHQPIPNIEPENQVADQNVENLPEDGVVDEEIVVAEEENQEQETDEHGIIPTASNVLTNTIAPQTLPIVAPVSPSLENETKGEDSGEGDDSEEHKIPPQKEMDAVSENKSVVEKKETVDSVESGQDGGPLVKNAVGEEDPQGPPASETSVIPQLLDSDSNTVEPPKEIKSTVPATDDATVEEEIVAPNIEPHDEIAEQNVDNSSDDKVVKEECVVAEEELIPAGPDELTNTLPSETSLLENEPQLLDSDSNTAEPPKELESTVPTLLDDQVQDTVVGDNVLVEEQNQEPVSIQQESMVDSVKEPLSTHVPVSIPTSSDEKIPSSDDCHGQKLKTEGEGQPVSKPSNDPTQETADCDNTTVEKIKEEIAVKKEPICQDNPKSTTKWTKINSRAIKMDASTMTDPLPKKSLPSQPETVDQELTKQEAENQDSTVPPPEGSDSTESSSQPKEPTEEQAGKSETVEEQPVAPKVVPFDDQDRLNVITTGKLGIFYTTIFLVDKSFWGSKPDVLKKIDEFFMGKKRRALNEQEGRLAIDLMKARGQDDCPKTKALYCALSEFLCGGRGEQDFSLRILILLQEKQGLLNVLRKMERTLFAELQDCADKFLNRYLNDYLQYHENRYVLKKPIEENAEYEWRSSLPNIQVPAEYPSFKECKLVKEGKERHIGYGNQAEKKPLYAAFYDFLTTTKIESKVLDLDFCLLETAIAANPDTRIIELEFKLFGGIFEHFENVDPNYTIKLLK